MIMFFVDFSIIEFCFRKIIEAKKDDSINFVFSKLVYSYVNLLLKCFYIFSLRIP